MIQFLNVHKLLPAKNKKLILMTSCLTLLLSAYFILWHYTSLVISGSHSVLDVPAPFMKMASYYLMLGAVVSSLICIVMLIIKKRMFKKIFTGFLLFLFFGSEVIRMFQWGALYFGGSLIDGNFWSHAFYADGLIFLLTKQAFILYAAVGVFFAAVVYVLNKLASFTNSAELS